MKMIKSIFNTMASLLLGLSILLPTVVVSIKIIILVIIIFLLTFLLLNGKARLSSFTIIAALFYVFLGFAWSIYGLINSNPGAINVLTVMGIYPILFTLIGSAFSIDDKKSILNLFINLSMLLGLINLIYVFGYILIPENPLQLILEGLYRDEAVVDAADNYFKFTLPNISSCIFLMPFLLINLIHSNNARIRSGIGIILMIAVMFLSGRRGFFISVLSGLIVAYLITFKSSHKLKFNYKLTMQLIIVAVFIGLIFLNYYGAEFYIEQILSIFDFTDNDSNIERARQFDVIMQEFTHSPFFGAGGGAAAGYSRSVDQPWAYELSYVAFLFHYGIIGLLIYALGIIILVYFLVDEIRVKGRNTFEFCYLAGFFSFMIANSTNPYLGKFDYMWVIFIPVALMNQRLVLRSKFFN